jgi:hypothetical protein
MALDHDDDVAHASDDPVPSGEPAPTRRCSERCLRHDGPSGRHGVPELSVHGRIRHVEPGGGHTDGRGCLSTGVEHAGVCCPVDAERKPRHHHHPGRCQVATELGGYLPPIRRGGARPDDGHGGTVGEHLWVPHGKEDRRRARVPSKRCRIGGVLRHQDVDTGTPVAVTDRAHLHAQGGGSKPALGVTGMGAGSHQGPGLLGTPLLEQRD